MQREIRGRVVTPHGVIEDGIVRISAGLITEAVPADPGSTVPTTAAWIMPGFVDIHVHGGGGHSFTAGDPAHARAAAGFHLRHGTTTMLASLVAAPLPQLCDATVALTPLIREGVLAGLHYEGPYLAPAQRGAHNLAFLRAPDQAELNQLIGLGAARMITLAPELPGALAAIRLLVAAGVVVAVGHTDATYEQTIAAIDAGASVATHLCNAMRPAHHRAPGPVVALLNAATVTCELIADGVHLHDGMLDHVIRLIGPGRVALVTDAMMAAGMPDGEYDLGGEPVVVLDGVARLTANAAIAGSTLTMDAALRRVVHNGASLADAATMTATTPAHAIGLGRQVGAIAAGLRADLILLDHELNVIIVLRNGDVVGGEIRATSPDLR